MFLCSALEIRCVSLLSRSFRWTKEKTTSLWLMRSFQALKWLMQCALPSRRGRRYVKKGRTGQVNRGRRTCLLMRLALKHKRKYWSWKERSRPCVPHSIRAQAGDSAAKQYQGYRGAEPGSRSSRSTSPYRRNRNVGIGEVMKGRTIKGYGGE